jgi:hypothetical protein
VGEDEDGHLIVTDRHPHGPSSDKLAEDGHYSSREEQFKRALAAAYRAGYEKEASVVEHERGDGDRGRDSAERRGDDGDGRREREGEREHGREERRDEGRRDDREGERRDQGRREEERERGDAEREERGRDQDRHEEDRRDGSGDDEGRRRNDKFTRALSENTGKGPFKRMHDALHVMATAQPNNHGPQEPPHTAPSSDWTHFWEQDV